MIKTLFLIFSFIILSNINAQNKITIELKDGTVLNGYGRIKVDESILYQKTDKAEKEFYDYKTVKKLFIYIDESKQEYEYKIVEGSGGVGSVKLIKILKVGKVNLYQDFSSGMAYHPNMPDNFKFASYAKITYYISKNGSDTVKDLRSGNTYSKRFKEIARKYFGECPDLLKKIDNKFFKRFEIDSVVEYYNKKCN